MVDHDLDEALPPRDVLEAYTVPDLPLDFTDRVMASLHPTTTPHRPVRAPWIVAGVATACAIAATALLVLTPRREVTQVVPVVAATPAGPAAEPVPVAAPIAAATGDLVIEATPHDAIVRIDGVPIGESLGGSPFVRTNLPVGTHVVEVERDGFLPWHRSIDLPPRALHLKVELHAAEVAPTLAPGTPVPEPRARPRASKRPAGSPDLKNPFGTPVPDLEDPFAKHEPAKPGSSSPDMKDPFGGFD